jgi:hypothetical protein
MDNTDLCEEEVIANLPNINDVDISKLLVNQRSFYRLNDSKYSSALNFGDRGKGRFDGPSQGYKILYTGENIYAAFAECFLRNPQQKRNITEALIRDKVLFEINSCKQLTFADLTGKGLNIIGTSNDIICGDQITARKWAKAIFLHPQMVDGIKYRSRLDPDQLNYGIFDRAKEFLSENKIGNLADDNRSLLAEILDHYDYDLI